MEGGDDRRVLGLGIFSCSFASDQSRFYLSQLSEILLCSDKTRRSHNGLSRPEKSIEASHNIRKQPVQAVKLSTQTMVKTMNESPCKANLDSKLLHASCEKVYDRGRVLHLKCGPGAYSVSKWSVCAGAAVIVPLDLVGAPSPDFRLPAGGKNWAAHDLCAHAGPPLRISQSEAPSALLTCEVPRTDETPLAQTRASREGTQ